jgi:hypothetical protein
MLLVFNMDNGTSINNIKLPPCVFKMPTGAVSSQREKQFDELPVHLKRPPSYSDSFFVLGREALMKQEQKDLYKEEEIVTVKAPLAPRISLFFIKSAIHIFLISVFETIFFFKYVSVNENNGIMKTINTYYQPIISNCGSWSNQTKEFIDYILVNDVNMTVIDSNSIIALNDRLNYNNKLLEQSLLASGICLLLSVIGGSYLVCKKTPVRWRVVIGENVSMVLLLGLYEWLFFRFIVYNYDTLSTAELNSYIFNGLYSCAPPIA